MEQNSPSSSDTTNQPADVVIPIENNTYSQPSNAVNGQNVQKVLNFLKNPSVNPLNYESNYSFLRSKGITDHEIQTAYSHLGRNKMIDQRQAPVLVAQQGTVSIWSKLRDIANLSVLLYFIYKAARHLFMFYIKPWFTGVPKSSEEMTEAESSETNAVVPCQCESETSRLSNKIVAMKTEMNSMKTLLLSNVSSTTVSIPKVIPRWQQTKAKTNGVTTSDKEVGKLEESIPSKVEEKIPLKVEEQILPKKEEEESLSSQVEKTSPPKEEMSGTSSDNSSSVLPKEDT